MGDGHGRPKLVLGRRPGSARFALGLALATTVAIGRCAAPSASAGPASHATATSSSAVPASPAVTLEAPSLAASIQPSAADRPAWTIEPLTDVRTGTSVRLADLKGSLVLLEGMATWCPPCVTQQTQAQAVLAGKTDRSIVYISLEIDPRESPETVARYADEHGFRWRFVVASQSMLRALAKSFGDLVLSPPSTPIIVIRPDGSAYLTEAGIKSAARLTELIESES